MKPNKLLKPTEKKGKTCRLTTIYLYIKRDTRKKLHKKITSSNPTYNMLNDERTRAKRTRKH